MNLKEDIDYLEHKEAGLKYTTMIMQEVIAEQIKDDSNFGYGFEEFDQRLDCYSKLYSTANEYYENVKRKLKELKQKNA